METQPLINVGLNDKRDLGQERGTKRRKCIWKLCMWCLGIIQWNNPTEESAATANELAFNGRTWTNRKLMYVSYLGLMVLLSSASAFTLCWYTQCALQNTKTFMQNSSFILFYWPIIASAHFLSIYANFRNLFGNVSEITWSNLFHEGNLWSKFQQGYFEDISVWQQACVLLIVYGMAFINTFLEIHYLTYIDADCLHLTEYICTISNIVSMFFYCTFCSFLYLNRKALQIACRKTVQYIKINTDRPTDCQEKVYSVFKEYLQLRKLLFPWLNMVMFCTTFGVTVFINWDFRVTSGSIAPTAVPVEDHLLARSSGFFYHNFICDVQCKGNSTDVKQQDIRFIEMVMGEKIMVVISAMVVVGAMDMRYIWDEFRIKVNMMYTIHKSRDASTLKKYVKHLPADTSSSTVATYVIPLMGVVCGILSGNRVGIFD